MLKDDRLLNAIIAKKMNGKIFVSCVEQIALYGVSAEKNKEKTNTEKLQASLSRSKKIVFEIAYCNPWDYFATITFDRKKIKNRYAIQDTLKTLREWINNYKRKNKDFAYLLIPELHKDGAVHVHGFLKGIPKEDLKSFKEYPDSIIKKNDLQKLIDLDYINWLPCEKKFGRNSLGAIKSREGVAYYVTKYISKDMVSAVKGLNLNTYYCSKNLKRAERIGIYDSPKISAALLGWDWSRERETHCEYKRTFDNERDFSNWLIFNRIKLIQD